MPHLLLVDDEINILNALRRVCWNEKLQPDIKDLRITTFESPFTAIEFASHHPVDLVLSDFRMPEMNGVAFLRRVRELQPNAARIIISAINDAAIFRFIAKPWDPVELKETIGAALAHHQQLVENQNLADEARLQRGSISPHELALRQLEAESPGITKVHWDENGGVLLES